MFDKLIDFLLSTFDQVLPFEIIEHYNRGARLRFGRKIRCLEPGLHFKWPFINSTQLILVVPKTIKLSEQSIKTKDGFSVVVKSVIKYEISDALKAALDVNDPVDAIADMTQGIIRKTIIDINLADCNDPELETKVTKKAKVEADKWGINIIKVTFTDLDEVPSFRIFNSSARDESYE